MAALPHRSPGCAGFSNGLSEPVRTWAPDVMDLYLYKYLEELVGALDDVAGGAPSVFFQTDGPKAASHTDETFRAKVAAVAELLHRAGDTVDAACGEVARQLNAMGWEKPYGRKEGNERKGPITGATVRQWRKDANGAPADSWTYRAYRLFLDTGVSFEKKGLSSAQWAQTILEKLERQHPDFVSGLTPADRPTP